MNTASAVENQVNPGLVMEMLRAHERTAALKAAIDLDLFSALGDSPVDVAAIASHCSASVRGTRILCDFLTICGVLAKEGTGYRHTPTSAAFLDPRSPASMASTAQFLAHPAMLVPYGHLAEIVRSGRTSMPGDGTVAPDNPIWVEFAESMAPMMGPISRPFAAAVLDGHSGPMRVLDVAAGHGLFGIAVARQNPQARITALDWEQVLRVARRNAARAGVLERFEMLPGSAFDVPFGEGYDAVLLTNFLHHFDPPTCVTLLKKVRAALRPGGRVATLEFVANEDRISPPAAASFSMVMLATTAAGDAYTFRDLSAMYTEAGFSGITARALEPSPETAVIGHA